MLNKHTHLQMPKRKVAFHLRPSSLHLEGWAPRTEQPIRLQNIKNGRRVWTMQQKYVKHVNNAGVCVPVCECAFPMVRKLIHPPVEMTNRPNCILLRVGESTLTVSKHQGNWLQEAWIESAQTQEMSSRSPPELITWWSFQPSTLMSLTWKQH